VLGVFGLMPALDTTGSRFEAGAAWLSLHVALFALAYGAFGLSCIAAVMYLTQERDLKLHKLRALLAHLPPIQRLETVSSGLLLTGFVMLTAALVVSFFGVERIDFQHWRQDPKIMWSIFV